MKELPTKLELDEKILPQRDLENITEIIGDYISSKYGHCVNCYSYNLKINVYNIDYDINEEDK